MLKAARTPVLNTGSAEEKRAEIKSYFQNTWEIYERLFDVMASDEAFFLRPDPLRHPLVFYLGHTAVFFVNKLLLAKIIPERVDPRFESIFAIGVDEMSWDDLNEQNYDWPTITQVWEYRNKVKVMVEQTIDNLPLQMPVTWDDPFWVIMMGIEHERIHLETSSVLIRQLPLDQVRDQDNWPVCQETSAAPKNTLKDVPAGTVVLGKEDGHGLYGWDNEFGRQETEITDFQASEFLVSNAEFKKFVDAGGYETEEYWTEEGWKWRNYRQSNHPVFWVADDQSSFKLRCMTREIPMPEDWPAEVNQLEAKAFCNWKAKVTGEPIRLPTEQEWYRLLEHTKMPDQPGWKAVPGNINLAEGASSCPVNKHKTAGFGDVVGNVWQWTETPISGFTGFRVHPFYDDFSTPTFDTQHNLIKGGSWISTGNETTHHSRYAFRRHFFQHAGFRYVRSDQPVVITAEVYESDDMVSQYCEFHYGDDYFGVKNFPAEIAKTCAEVCSGRTIKRALDLGCATGRATFELAKFCDFVTGIDFSARFVRVGIQMQEQGFTRYAIPEEGDLVSYHERSLSDMGLENTKNKVEFWQGDAHNLKEQFTNYDLVLAGNLIDRLYDPTKFLNHIAERINPGGLLVIFSPYTWLADFTPHEKWLGGIKVNGENQTTPEGMALAMKGTFKKFDIERDVEFVIRETRRKYQHSVSNMTVWEKI